LQQIGGPAGAGEAENVWRGREGERKKICRLLAPREGGLRAAKRVNVCLRTGGEARARRAGSRWVRWRESETVRVREI
jgi:hypothetical protein